jgi:lysophospholipase L1-like esterase
MIGGSNDIDKSVHGKNITSIVNFLDGAQNTNVILVEVPVRYNIGARSHINKQIENYNKKLYKLTKSFKHVKLTKVTTNREHFTKHGLHLNNKGKEIMSKELLKNLPIKHESQKVSAIQLHWKNDYKSRCPNHKERKIK